MLQQSMLLDDRPPQMFSQKIVRAPLANLLRPDTSMRERKAAKAGFVWEATQAKRGQS
jgi:hypothetical protein